MIYKLSSSVLMDLPPPGPEHFAARRARWLASPAQPRQLHCSPSQARLQVLLAHPHPHTDAIWYRGIHRVWKGISNGDRLKHPLPMSIVIKVIHTAWRRDPETWPEGAVVPDSDEPRTITPSLPDSPSPMSP